MKNIFLLALGLLLFNPLEGFTEAAQGDSIKLAMRAGVSGAGIVGAYGQHKDPIHENAGRITPREITIKGKTYGIRGWYTQGDIVLLNFDTDQQDADFQNSGVSFSLGQGDTIRAADMRRTNALRHRVGAQYSVGQEYAITIWPTARKRTLVPDSPKQALEVVLADRPQALKVETEEQKIERLRNEQIARLKAWRAEWMRKQQEAEQAYLDSIAAEAQKARDQVKALRAPPAKVWRVGNTIFWEPPETADQLRPAGYWISEKRNGEWTAHGDYLLPHAREADLFGNGPAQVEAYYHDTALGEAYISPVVEASPGEPWWLVSRVRFYASETHKGKEHTDRWRRVLAAFGATEAKVGWAGRAAVGPLHPPVTAAEAEGYVERGWSRWIAVATTLRRLEAEVWPEGRGKEAQ